VSVAAAVAATTAEVGPRRSAPGVGGAVRVRRRLLPPVALAWAVLPLALDAQAAPARAPVVDTLLYAAGIPNVLAGMGSFFQAQVSRIASGSASEDVLRVRQVGARHFAADRLYESVAAALADEPAERLEAVAAWLSAGPVAEARALVEAYRPPVPLESYASSLADDPPPPARVAGMHRLARGQGAALLYLTIAESLRGAAHMALRAVEPEVPPFRGVSDAQAAELLEAHDQQTVLLFLHRFEPVSDALVARWAEAYESDAGRWYVDALSRSVRDALLSAAERSVEELRSGRPRPPTPDAGG
jgi:hypothetical protein